MSFRFVAVLVAISAGFPLGQVLAAKKPNILFLFADDQRKDAVAAFGNPHIETPNIDRLVRGGFSFRENYCFGSSSGVVCVPSRAMLMSGRTWFAVRSDMSNARVLFPELLQQNGYVTFGTGKWHNGKPSWQRCFQRGKSIFFGGMSDHTKVPLYDLGQGGKLIDRSMGDNFSSTLFADAAVDFLNGYDGDKPFLCYVAFTSPHDPRQPPKEYRENTTGRNCHSRKTSCRSTLFTTDNMVNKRDESLLGWPRQPEMVRDQLAEYYGMITHMDGQIGRILAALEKSGHAKNTLVVYAADHGLAMGSHGLLGKQSVYEHSMKCPLVFNGPGVPAGKSSRAFTYLLDFYLTLCDYAGLPKPGDLAGHSLKPIWDGESDSVRDSVFLPFRDIQRAVRQGRWKLILYPKIKHTQLFDLESDPDEIVNLATRKRMAKRIDEMTKLMVSWQKRVGDKLPLTVAKPAPKEIDMTGRSRVNGRRWQPDWILKKYFGD